MRKLFILCRSMFTREIFILKHYTIKEFFENGGSIFTLMPDHNDGRNLADYCRYLSLDAFLKDWPEYRWNCGEHTKYEILGAEATFESASEIGFVVRVPKRVPRYDNVALAITFLGLLISLITMFCIGMIVGFLSLGVILSGTGITLYRISSKEVVTTNE